MEQMYVSLHAGWYALHVLLRLLCAALVALITLLAPWHVSSAIPAASPRYLVVIVMDGFRADYETLAQMKHLHELMARGMTYDTAWVGQMESETPPGHATIATGVYPKKHGVVGFGWRDVTSGQFVWAPTDLASIARGDLTKTIEGGGVPTISDEIHAHNKHDLVVSISGEKYYAAAAMGAGADYVLYGKDDTSHGPFRATAVGPNIPPASTHYNSVTIDDSYFDEQDKFGSLLAVQMVKTLHPRALLLNLPATDIAGHYYGGMADRKDMTPIIKSADWAIGRVMSEYQHLGIFNQTEFIVTADHGMASNAHIVPVHRMYNLVRTLGVQQLDQEYRISVGSIWMKDPQHAQMLATAMDKAHFNGVEGALYKVQTPNGPIFQPDAATAQKLSKPLLRAYLDLADTEAGPTGPEVILPYAENTTGLVQKRKTYGSHGGFSWGVQHIPLVIEGPGVRHGLSHFPAKLVDIAPTIERLMGLPVPARVDGVVLGDALSASNSADRAAQVAVAGRRLADLNAIRAHSEAQIRGR